MNEAQGAAHAAQSRRLPIFVLILALAIAAWMPARAPAQGACAPPPAGSFLWLYAHSLNMLGATQTALCGSLAGASFAQSSTNTRTYTSGFPAVGWPDI